MQLTLTKDMWAEVNQGLNVLCVSWFLSCASAIHHEKNLLLFQGK